MINWKVALWTGIGGFLLSFLIGIIGGVLFGALILRALQWGLLFAFLGAALHYVISRFLPEMLASTDAKQGGSGSIDIVLPEEMPHAASEENGEGVEELPAEELEEAAGEIEEIPMAEEVEESEPRTAGMHEESSFFSAIKDEEAELPEELPEFEGEILPEGRSQSSSAAFAPKRASSRAPASSADPAEIARAIRTVLKKDQKG